MLIRRPVQLPHKMLSRLLASHILLVTIPLLATGYFLIRTAKSNFEDFILERNREIALRSARQIELTLESVFEKLRLTANNPAIYGPNALYQQRIIHNLVKEFAIFREISILDPNGNVLQSTAFEGQQNGGIVANFAALRDRLISGIEYFSDVYLSKDQLPMMDIYEPVFNELDEVAAVLLARVDLKEMWDLVDNSRLGGHGAEAFVIRPNGRYVAHTNREMVIKAGQYFLEPRIQNNIADLVAASEIYTNRAGVEVVVAYAPIRARNLSWGIVIQQPTSQAFAVVDKMQVQIQLLLGASVIVASLIAFFYSRIILRPVTRLAEGIKRIASGDLHFRLEPLGRDEISQLAEHINEMSARLRNIQNQLKRSERLETLSKLASVLSHEIRNPLNSMVINMQILSREFRKPSFDIKKLEHYSKVVASEIKRVDDLVSNFLLIAKPPKLNLEKENLTVILNELIASQQPLALSQGVRIERRYGVEPVYARVDEAKIKQVFLNIILNGIQAMPGGGKLIIEMARENPGDSEDGREFVKISFKDTGKGIKKEELKHIFDFYYSTKPKGTGLGLSVAQQIVEEHGGSIRVLSKYGHGATFVIFLPVNLNQSS